MQRTQNCRHRVIDTFHAQHIVTHLCTSSTLVQIQNGSGRTFALCTVPELISVDKTAYLCSVVPTFMLLQDMKEIRPFFEETHLLQT